MDTHLTIREAVAALIGALTLAIPTIVAAWSSWLGRRENNRDNAIIKASVATVSDKVDDAANDRSVINAKINTVVEATKKDGQP